MSVGTSGWSYKSWRGPFYRSAGDSSRWLASYAQHFATVEVNTTFYGLTATSTLRSWHDAVPDDFVFAVKASRYLTHVRRLVEPREPVERLLERTSALGSKRGPVLLQLPPDLPIALDRLDETLDAFGPHVEVAVEVRHPSWDCGETMALLGRHGAALCLTDRRGLLRPYARTSPWGYVRFHAGRAQPAPCYGRQALTSWAGRLGALWPASANVYAFFNNDERACAPSDARRFGLACARAGLEPTRLPAAADVRPA